MIAKRYEPGKQACAILSGWLGVEAMLPALSIPLRIGTQMTGETITTLEFLAEQRRQIAPGHKRDSCFWGGGAAGTRVTARG